MGTEAWNDEQGTAYHEAGHHVAFRHLRPLEAEGDCGEISIVPNEQASGYHAPVYGFEGHLGPDGTETFDPRSVEYFIVELYAGAAADLHHNPESRSGRWHLSDPTPDEEQEAEEGGAFADYWESDREKAEAWLAWLAPDRGARSALRQRLRVAAHDLVGAHWDEIRALAEALAERKRMDNVEAGFVIQAAAGDVAASADLARYRAMMDGNSRS